MLIHERLYTVSEFAELLTQPEYADKHVELVDGVIVEMAKPTGEHGEIAGNIFGFIWNHAREHKLGRVTATETGFILGQSPAGKDIVRGLDAAFIAIERAPDPLPAELVALAPDLAVEVISPGNTASDINRKIHELFNAGTRLIWIVYPDTRSVDVHRRDSARTLYAADTLDGEDVLPGFKLQVAEIFP